MTDEPTDAAPADAGKKPSNAGLWGLAILLGLLAAALIVLSVFDEKLKLRKLHAKLYSTDPDERMQAVWGLERADKEGRRLLAEGARSESPATRQESIAALARAGGREWMALIDLALGDENPSVRCEATVAVVALADAGAAQRLRPALDTEACKVARHTLALALLKAGDESGAPVLIEHLADEAMGKSAAAQLAAFTKESFGRDAEKWRKWWASRPASERKEDAPRPKPFGGTPATPPGQTTPPPAKIVSEKDGASMALIPAGEFIAGTDDGPEDERPRRKLHLAAFYIDVHEVTCAQWQTFLRETGYAWEGQFARWVCLDTRRELDPRYGRHPVTNVSRADAKAYAKWAGKSIPTEAEWEKAARDTDGRRYPWGNEWLEDSVVSTGEVRRLGYTIPNAVGTRPFDRTSYGVADMAGGVREWTAGDYAEGVGVVRGGTCNYQADYARCADRHPWPSRARGPYLGFRCAKDAASR